MRGGRLTFAFAVLLAEAAAFFACDGTPREESPRFYIPPDAEEDSDAAIAEGGALDAPLDVDAAPDAELDAGDAEAGPTGPLLATGSGHHPDPLVGFGDHTCAVARGDAGGVYCWGANDTGQLGLGTTGAGTTAADVPTATRIAVDETGLSFEPAEELALSAWHSCARRRDVVFCWGERSSGAQAEPPNASDASVPADRTRPRAIGNFDVARIAAGGPHGCALKSNGKVSCFGHSTFNELGRPNADDPLCVAPFFYDYHATPTHKCSGALLETMTAVPGVSQVALGEVHSCVLAAGRVRCWGTNLGGQLGRPGNQAGELNPQEVVTDPALLVPLDGVTALAAGGKHACAVKAGAVLCWGTNDLGQLGADPALVPLRDYAAPVPGIATVVSIGVAETVTCAVRADKTAWCWGKDLAALGDAGAVVGTPTPLQIKGPGGVGALTDVVEIAPGIRHACARKADGSVWCWGKNDRGQLGDGTTVDSAFPVKVVGLP